MCATTPQLSSRLRCISFPWSHCNAIAISAIPADSTVTAKPNFDVGQCCHTGPSSAGPGPLPPPAGPPPGFAPGHLPPPSGPPPGMMMPRMPPPMMPPPGYAVLMPPPPGQCTPSCCCRRLCCCCCICLQAVWLNALYASMHGMSLCMQTCCTACNPRRAAELS